MNIHTAAVYMQYGYKFRRPHWHMSEYIYAKDGAIFSREHEYHGHSIGGWVPGLECLLADDWEMIPDDKED